MKLLLRLIIIVALVSIALEVYAQNPKTKCEIIESKTNRRFVEFRDGEKRVVHLIFAKHLPPRDQKKIVNQFLNDKITNGGLAKYLRQFLRDHQSLLSEYEEDMAQVRSLLNPLNSKPISFIGIEGSPETIENQKSIAIPKINLYREQMIDAGLTEDEIKNVFKLWFGRLQYIYFHENQFQNVELVGLDEDPTFNQNVADEQNLQISQNQIKKELMHPTSSRISDSLRKIFNNHLDLLDNATDANFDSLKQKALLAVKEIDSMPVQNSSEESLRNSVSYGFDLFIEFFQYRFYRNKNFAQRILGLSGNGIVNVGDKHKSGVIYNLKKQCEEN